MGKKKCTTCGEEFLTTRDAGKHVELTGHTEFATEIPVITVAEMIEYLKTLPQDAICAADDNDYESGVGLYFLELPLDLINEGTISTDFDVFSEDIEVKQPIVVFR